MLQMLLKQHNLALTTVTGIPMKVIKKRDLLLGIYIK
jgi:hypothetical protein